jgi:hypothetical protein
MYILYLHKILSKNLILICWFGYVVILFQSYRISFYITNLSWFWHFTHLHHKQQYHSK